MFITIRMILKKFKINSLVLAAVQLIRSNKKIKIQRYLKHIYADG